MLTALFAVAWATTCNMQITMSLTQFITILSFLSFIHTHTLALSLSLSLTLSLFLFLAINLSFLLFAYPPLTLAHLSKF